MLKNLILETDSYKLSHAPAYPQNVIGMSSYIEARTGGRDLIIPFGLQMWLMKTLSRKITKTDIDEAQRFAKVHGEPFVRKPWEYIIHKYNGFLPVKIRSVPEGTPVRSGNALVTIESTDPYTYWLASYLETSLLRGFWYPTTIATLDYDIKKEIFHFYRISGADVNMVPFALHDFGARGVTSSEQAEIGGAAHLVNFSGSDTIEGVRAANYYYNDPMSGFSIPATEHSIECSWGSSPEQEYNYLNHVLDVYASTGTMVSIVLDGYDVYRAAEQLCTRLKSKIINSGAKVVFRPDSGDMFEVIPRLLNMQESAFGSVLNSKGYRKINNVGIIQGDGIDRSSIKLMLNKLLLLGYSADNMVFGSGGGLLQKVNRDTLRFAQKASAILVEDVTRGQADCFNQHWVGISKTTPGKESKSGRLTLVRSRVSGEYMTSTLDFNKNEFEDVMQTVYNNGLTTNKTTLAEIRSRCFIG
jgi:nicotinamide phosphoribosyltransferase